MLPTHLICRVPPPPICSLFRPPPAKAPRPHALPYRKPQEGRDYWVIDAILPDPMAVRERALAASDWELGLPNGGLGGNLCPAQFTTLPEALGMAKLPLAAWAEDVVVPNAFNRLLLYRADLVHSATGYFGHDDATKRMTVLFFWMA